MPDKTEMPESLTLFSEWLKDHAQGHANDEITLDLADAVESTRVHNKPSEVTIKVKIEPAGGHGRQVTTAVTSTAKLAKGDPEVSIFYTGENGSLHRDDPFEPKLRPEFRIGYTFIRPEVVLDHAFMAIVGQVTENIAGLVLEAPAP